MTNGKHPSSVFYNMKHLTIFLFSLLLITSCEREEDLRINSCGDTVTLRLGLVQENPGTSCSLQVNLFAAQDTTYYMVSSMTCYIEPRYYTCAGDPLLRESINQATPGKFLGYLPTGLPEEENKN